MKRSISHKTSNKSLRFLESQSQGGLLGLFAIGTLGLHLVIFFVLVLQYGAYSNLASKPPPSLVQLGSGEAIAVAPLGSQERTPEVVLNFVVSTMTLMMNWSGQMPPTNFEEAAKPVLDPGVEMRTIGAGKKGKITTSSWQAGFAFSEDFRKEFLQKIAELTPGGVFEGKTQVALVPINIRPPVKIEEGKWKVGMVANLMVFDKGSNLGEVIEFNKEIFVQAVEVPVFTKTGVAAVIHKMRSSGLEIYAIRDLHREDL